MSASLDDAFSNDLAYSDSTFSAGSRLYEVSSPQTRPPMRQRNAPTILTYFTSVVQPPST